MNTPAPADTTGTPSPRLTRTDQAIDVLHAGGSLLLEQAHDMDRHPALTLLDAEQHPVPARFDVRLAAHKRCTLTDRTRTITGGIREVWRLTP